MDGQVRNPWRQLDGLAGPRIRLAVQQFQLDTQPSALTAESSDAQAVVRRVFERSGIELDVLELKRLPHGRPIDRD